MEDSEMYKKFVILPANIRRDLTEWFENSNEVKIFITGRTGVGKSTLVNGLVGNEIAKEGDGLDPETAEVTGYEREFRSIKVTVWDSPGLQDGTSNEAQYLADMKEKCSDMDICIYCVSLMETRIYEGCPDIIAMKKLTEVFGKRMWDNAMFVLTFANLAEDLDSEILEAKDEMKPQKFQAKIQKWRDELANILINHISVDEEVAKQIQVVPAGHANEPALLDRDHWLSPIWFAVLYATNPRAQPAMIKLNHHRIVDNGDEVRDEDLHKFIHEQPIIFSKRGALVGAEYGQSEVGEAIGRSMANEVPYDVVLALEIHSTFMARAIKIGQTFLEQLKNIFRRRT